MAKKEVLIPYDKHGSIPWEHPWKESAWTWKPQAHFRARLQFHRIITIRSGFTVRMMNADTGAIYPMKGDQFLELISDMVYGVLPVMVWEPYKVGSNYNIRRITSG